MVDPVVLHINQAGDGVRQVGRVGRVAELVGDDAQGALFVRRGDDLGDEVVAAVVVQPGRAGDVEAASHQS